MIAQNAAVALDAERPRHALDELDWRTYDDFSSGVLAPDRWAVREVNTSDGSPWRYEEPGARYVFNEGGLEIHVDRFERCHHQIQNFDNAKLLILSESVFTVPETGCLAISVRMAAEKLGGNANDFRDGFASLNVVDFETGIVLDIMATGERHGAIYERMPHTTPYSFLHVVDAPLHSPETAPGRWHDVAIEIDAVARTARWFVDDKVLMAVSGMEIVPKSVRIGLGMLTIRPLGVEGSTSLRGQGLIGKWGAFRVGQRS